MTESEFTQKLFEINSKINLIEQMKKLNPDPLPMFTDAQLGILYEWKHNLICKAIDLGLVEKESA